MSAFKINGQSASSPIGFILAYMGTDAPEGWIFCDGVQRTNGQDGRYNNLIAAKIGSGTANANYTPPNMINQLLRGASSSIGAAGGSDTVSLTTDNLPSHTHNVTDPSHNHTVKDPGHIHNASTTMDNTMYWDKTDQNNTGFGYSNWEDNTGIDNYETTITKEFSNISCKKNKMGTIVVSSIGITTPSSINIIPEYINVNFIIKY